MVYTAICEALKKERMAAVHDTAEQAKAEYGEMFSSTFEYRRGSEHIVRGTDAAIARHYRSLHSTT